MGDLGAWTPREATSLDPSTTSQAPYLLEGLIMYKPKSRFESAKGSMVNIEFSFDHGSMVRNESTNRSMVA